jgi:thiamine-phosphate pyrophosphorylase
VIPRSVAISGGAGLLSAGELEGWIEALAAAEVDAVQLREKELGDRELFQLARRVVDLAAGRLAVLVNGRADLALAAGAAGVHLPATGLPAPPLRRRCGRDFLIGRSTHRPEEVVFAREEGCDYAFFGPLRPTPSKDRQAEVPGLAGLAAACREGLPVLALGGVETLDDLEAAAAAGAAGVAGIRAFRDAPAAALMAGHARRLWPRPGAA